MLKAFPRHTPFATMTPGSPTAHNEKTLPCASCLLMMALASASPNLSRKHSVRLSEVKPCGSRPDYTFPFMK
jgi:hypothetical protein